LEEGKGVISVLLKTGAYASGVLIASGLIFGAPDIVLCGIYVMVATPVLRVAVLLIAYLKGGEKAMAATAAAVLALIGLSAYLGKVH